MKKQLAGLELHFLIKELKEFEGSKVDQIYQKNKDEFIFQMHKTNFGKFLIKINLPSMMYITKYKGEQPQTPPGFCTFLRRRLKNARLQEIKQLHFERIVQLNFSTKDNKINVFLELFGEGNIIVTDENLKIISLLQTQNWKDRTLRGGVQYIYPKRETNILEDDKEIIFENIKKSDKESIVKTLALEFGLGGIYAEELCAISDINKDKKDLDENEFEKLYEAILKIKDKPIKGIVSDNDIHPFEMNTKKTIQSYETFSEVLDEILTEEKINSENKVNVNIKEKETNKIKNMINQQEKRMKELEIEVEENQKRGEFIYMNYNLINELLNEAKKKIKNEETRKELLNNPIIKKIENKIMTIKIEEK
jgi:predicted ribosome quality control (RQC) complex YloA/Tae2 family protein